MIRAKYLADKNFLKRLDLENRKEQFIRIVVLDFQTEEPLANIEGRSTGGSCNLNGNSNMRRAASCSLVVNTEEWLQQEESQYYNITEINNLISLNKKVRIETGFTNTLKDLGYYEEYPIIWFPLGTYVIKTASVSKNNSGVNISLTLNDKSALLNGGMGGTLPAATIFSELDSYDLDGNRTVTKLLLKDIIRDIVVHYGGEAPENVIITDIDDIILKVVKWGGKESVYLYEGSGQERLVKQKPSSNSDLTIAEYKYGQDVGYMITDFVYPGTLEGSAGESAATILDKIKNMLGNFEWFYDLEGRFIFQQIKNYLNTSPTETLLNLTAEDYYLNPAFSTSVYTFDQDTRTLITSISNAPQYPNIKNDYVVWGNKKTSSGVDRSIRYHLAFQGKPKDFVNTTRPALVHTDPTNGIKNIVPLLPEGEGEKYYIGQPYSYSADIETKKKMFFIYSQNDKNYVSRWSSKFNSFIIDESYEACFLKTDDWRTELYYQGLWADDKTFTENYYAIDLKAEWPKIYDVAVNLVDSENFPNSNANNKISLPVYTGAYKNENQYDYDYWLDFIEGSPFDVDNIGRRSKIVTDQNINCIFPRAVPDYVYILANGDANAIKEERQKAESLVKPVIQVGEDVYSNLKTGGSQNSAFDRIKELLYIHSSYNETVNLSVIPIYYLEPNTLITVADNETGVNGEYIIQSISLPLTPNGTSSISATRLVRKTF